jgi:hypothetical protein
MVELVRAGLVTAQAERVATGGKSTEIARADHRRGARALAGPDAHFTRMYHAPSSTDSTDRIFGRS